MRPNSEAEALEEVARKRRARGEIPWDIVECFGSEDDGQAWARLVGGGTVAFTDRDAMWRWRRELAAPGARRERALRRAQR